MSDWDRYSDDEFGAIAEEIFGTGRYRHGIGPIETPCPKCGANATVHVDETRGSRPVHFRASCVTCHTRGWGRATSAEQRVFTDEEMRTILERQVRGGEAFCPVCTARLQVREIVVSGSSPSQHYKATCLRCRSYGDMDWPPAADG